MVGGVHLAAGRLDAPADPRRWVPPRRGADHERAEPRRRAPGPAGGGVRGGVHLGQDAHPSGPREPDQSAHLARRVRLSGRNTW